MKLLKTIFLGFLALVMAVAATSCVPLAAGAAGYMYAQEEDSQ